MEKNFRRNCPRCNIEMLYVTEKSWNGAEKNQSKCFSCCGKIKWENRKKINPNPIYTTTIRNCPICNKEIVYKTGKACHEAKKNNIRYTKSK